ncbi:MAG: OmpA family protein [Myxococcota bacterium]
MHPVEGLVPRGPSRFNFGFSSPKTRGAVMSRVQIRAVLVALAMLALPGASLAQQVEESHPIAEDVASQISMFSYEEGPKSRLVFRGTPVAANGQGKAWVEYEKGNARIEVEVEKLPPPPRLGPYTVYILWALTPEGRAVNQGVIATNRKGSGEFKTSYGAPQFALIVTAEPHFAVSFPSTMVVLYNVADKVKGSESKVTALARSADYSKLTPIVKDKETNPIELVQARYALAIAAAAGAEKFAPQPFETARMKLMEAEAALADKKASVRKTATGLAREATLAGEDARRAGMTASEAAVEASRRSAAANAAAKAAAAVQRAQDEGSAAIAAHRDLENRLNAALPTHKTDRGLVSEIGGVQFATGTANLNSKAKEGLAKFAGIVASYPGLKFTIEGHTDNTGRPEVNKELSLKRALAVRDYLVGQGIAASSTDVAGLGSSMPIGDESTAEGRARNRRVEIVVSGAGLGR